MVHTKRIREFEFRPMNRRVSSSKYWTRSLASSTSLEAARRAMPTNLLGASSSKSIGARLYIRRLFASLSSHYHAGFAIHYGVVPSLRQVGFHGKLGS